MADQDLHAKYMCYKLYEWDSGNFKVSEVLVLSSIDLKRGLVHVINFVLTNVYPLSVATSPTKHNMISCHTNAINALKAYEAATNASCLYTSRLTL